jgi:hypothetical protein
MAKASPTQFENMYDVKNLRRDLELAYQRIWLLEQDFNKSHQTVRSKTKAHAQLAHVCVCPRPRAAQKKSV